MFTYIIYIFYLPLNNVITNLKVKKKIVFEITWLILSMSVFGFRSVLSKRRACSDGNVLYVHCSIRWPPATLVTEHLECG